MLLKILIWPYIWTKIILNWFRLKTPTLVIWVLSKIEEYKQQSVFTICGILIYEQPNDGGDQKSCFPSPYIFKNQQDSKWTMIMQVNFVYQVKNCLSERCQEMFNYQFIVKKVTLHLALSSKWIVKTQRKVRKHRYSHIYPTNRKLQHMAFRNLILKSCHPFNSAFNNWRTLIRFWVNWPVSIIRI